MFPNSGRLSATLSRNRHFTEHGNSHEQSCQNQTLATGGRDPGAAVVKALDPYFQKANDAFTPLLAALQTNVNAALTALNTFDATFKAAMAPDALRGFLNSALGRTIAGTDIPTVVANLRAKAWDADTVIKQWNSAVNAAIVQVKTAVVGTVKQVLIAQRDVLIQQLSPGGFVQNIINGLVPPAAAVTALNNFLKGPVSDAEGSLGGAATALNNIVNDAQIGLGQLKARLEQERDNLTKAARSYLDQAAAGLADTGVLQAADTGLRLVRAFGDPPRVPQLDFERSKLGYYFNQLGAEREPLSGGFGSQSGRGSAGCAEASGAEAAHHAGSGSADPTRFEELRCLEDLA